MLEDGLELPFFFIKKLFLIEMLIIDMNKMLAIDLAQSYCLTLGKCYT